jgi:hypothetical protein
MAWQENKNGIVVYKENGDLADQGTVKMAGFDEFDVKSDQENSQYRSVEYGTDDVTSWIRFSNGYLHLQKNGYNPPNKVKLCRVEIVLF